MTLELNLQKAISLNSKDNCFRERRRPERPVNSKGIVSPMYFLPSQTMAAFETRGETRALFRSVMEVLAKHYRK